MPTLVLNAPRNKVGVNEKLSFEQMFRDHLGHGYAIPREYAEAIQSDASMWHIVILDKFVGVRAEGEVFRLQSTGEKTSQGILRYDVYTSRLERVPYRPVSLMRTGIAILDYPRPGAHVP